MADRLKAKEFDVTKPNQTYEQVLRKGYRRDNTSEEALSRYAIESAKRTSEKYNIRYGYARTQKPTQKPPGKKP